MNEKCRWDDSSMTSPLNNLNNSLLEAPSFLSVVSCCFYLIWNFRKQFEIWYLNLDNMWRNFWNNPLNNKSALNLNRWPRSSKLILKSDFNHQKLISCELKSIKNNVNIYKKLPGTEIFTLGLFFSLKHRETHACHIKKVTASHEI